MPRLIYFMYIIWFLLLPLTVISSIYLGVALDKKIAPVLLFLWVVLYLFGSVNLDKGKISLLFIAISFFLIRNISFISNVSIFSELMWRDVIAFGYFAIPLMFISNNKKVKMATKLISFNAAVGCVTAFLVAFGILTLPYERFSQSRIGFEGIQKSIGLFSSYGDIAQYSVFFLILAFFIPSNIYAKKKYLVLLSVVIIIVMGLIGTQSRSFFLSLIAASIACVIFYYRNKKTTNKALNTLLLSFAALFVTIIMGYLFFDIVDVLSNIGGSQASTTAADRLGQYQLALFLIKEYPFLGVDAEFYLKNGYVGHFVHNMWLGQLVRGGGGSVVILLILLIKIFRKTLNLFADESTKPYAMVSLGYLAGVFVSILFYPADSMLFWAMLGMNASIVYTIKPEKQISKR